MARSSTTFSKGHRKIGGFVRGSRHTVQSLGIIRSTSFAPGHRPWNIGLGGKYCPECGIKISFRAARCRIHRVMTPEHCAAIARGKTGKHRIDIAGSNHPKWIVDRSLLKERYGSEERRSPRYKDWRKQVWQRDSFRCQIADSNCRGRIEAHHIRTWRDHPELRYKVNNGITLCHAHHPRRRIDERRMSAVFQRLVLETPTNTAY